MKTLYRNTLSLFILCFICALFLAAIHHHDKSFRNNTCSLCKLSSSLSIGVKKANLDGSFDLSVNYFSQSFTWLPNYEKIVIILFVTYFTIALHPQSNKAPPFQSL